MPLDPQAEKFLTQYNSLKLPPISEMPVEKLRAMVTSTPGEREPVAIIKETEIPGPAGTLNVKVYYPELAGGETPHAAIVYLHGGGWVTGTLKAYDHLCCALSHRSRSVVVSVDYRLAPENPYPAAIDDAFAATRWVATQLSSWDITDNSLVVMGDSAGGNLAAAVCQRAKREGGPKLDLQVLIYPITDHNLNTISYLENSEGYMLTRKSMEWFWDVYVPNVSRRREPDASPLWEEDLTDLPATFMMTCEFDPLRDEGIAYGRKLESQGVEVEYVYCKGMIHGFLRRTDTFDLSLKVLQQIADTIINRCS